MVMDRSVVGVWPGRARQRDPRDADVLTRLVASLERSERTLRHTLAHSVDTLDTIIYEHAVFKPGAIGSPTFTGTVPPQIRQMALIERIVASFFDPALTLLNGFVQLDDMVYSIGGGGTAPPNTSSFNVKAQPVTSQATRSITLTASGNLTAATVISVAFIGKAVPATLGEVLT